MKENSDNLENEHYKKVESVFQQVIDCPADDTMRLLDELCGNDTDLREEVEQLLAIGDETLGAFMQVSPLNDFASGLIAGYEIIEQIGEGGMGTVYLAEQKNPRRKVALKTLKSVFASPEMCRRFEYEAQVLGQLQHPGIAQVFDAGTMSTANAVGMQSELPYFVMELVDGCSLTDYATQKQLSPNDRLKLVIEICDAVQSAHQQGVVHRDLKPANILVNQNGAIKILDFGVARFVDSQQQIRTMVTQAGQLIGTLAYMSPEQLSGDSIQVDTRSDVYSIGIVLYELLSGKHPFDVRKSSLPEAISTIQNQIPSRLSKHDARFRGDVDTIAEKAIERDKTRRYQSATDLSADIQRYLNGLPIEARSPSKLYVMRKFVRRNIGLVTSLGLILLTVLIAGILVTNFAVKQSIALKDAKRQMLIADEVNKFVNDDLLAKADPENTSLDEVTVRVLLDAASEQIGNRFEGMPQVEAAIRLTIGRSYRSIGNSEPAILHLRRASELYHAELGPFDQKTLEAKDTLASAYLDSWQLDEAEQLIEETMQAAKTGLGEQHYMTARLHSSFGILMARKGDFAAAEKHDREAIRLWDEFDYGDPFSRNKIQNNLTAALSFQKKYDEAEQVARDLVMRWEQFVGRKHPQTAQGLAALQDILWTISQQKSAPQNVRKEKFDESALLADEVLKIRMNALGESNPETIRSLYASSLIDRDRGQFASALEKLERTVELRQAIYKTDKHIDIVDSTFALGSVYSAMGNRKQAAEMYEKAFRLVLPLVGPDHFKTRMCLSSLSVTWREMGDDQSLKQLFEEFGNQLSSIGKVQVQKDLAYTLVNKQIFSEAAQVQLRVVDELIDSKSTAKNVALETDRAAYFQIRAGDYPAAEKSMEQAIELYIQAGMAEDLICARSTFMLAEIKFQLGKYQAAKTHLEKSLEMQSDLPRDHDDILFCNLLLAKCLHKLGSSELAKEQFQSVIKVLEGSGPEKRLQLARTRRDYDAFLKSLDVE